jgi:hypothetical protein
MPRSSQWSLPFEPPNQNSVNTSPLPIRATCPAYLILLDLITLATFGCEVHHYAILSIIQLHSLLGPNILLNSLFSKILNLSSSHKVRDPYSTTGKITVMYTLIFRFLI